MSLAAPYAEISLGRVAVERETRGDGSAVLRSRVPLAPYPKRLTEKLLHWAEREPSRTFIARRGADGRWERLSYAQTRDRVLRMAASLLARGLGADRTIAILSGNSLEHALLALAAMHAGIPYAPISPAYSLMSGDFGKLRHTLGLMSPGLVFADDGAAYERALRSGAAGSAEIVVQRNAPAGLACTDFAELEQRGVGAAVDEAFGAIHPDAPAKILFTSGSTGQPKGVINTHRLMCSNLQQIIQAMPFLAEEPPVIVDWLPWNHTFGGNHNFGIVLYNGGTLYIDDGRPAPGLIEKTVANLRDVAPSIYFNVPKGFEDLLPYLRREPALRETFFSRLKMIFYAGAGLPQPVWDGLEELSAQATGRRVVISTGLGMTESGPSAMFAHWSGARSGHLGVPVSGLELKLVPVADKIEARYRGPNVTPGYWRQPELNRNAFDEEGYYRTGDAVRYLDPSDIAKGLLFDGRIAEDFKLNTGTWVSVGVLRAKVQDACKLIVQDAVIAAPDRAYLAVILFPVLPACRAVCDLPADAPADEVLAHPALRDYLRGALESLAASATGSSSRIRRAIVAAVPPSIDVGEITDKGSINQRIVLANRADLVEALYAEPADPRVITIAGT